MGEIVRRGCRGEVGPCWAGGPALIITILQRNQVLDLPGSAGYSSYFGVIMLKDVERFLYRVCNRGIVRIVWQGIVGVVSSRSCGPGPLSIEGLEGTATLRRGSTDLKTCLGV